MEQLSGAEPSWLKSSFRFALALAAGTAIAIVRPVVVFAAAVFRPVEPFYRLGSDEWSQGRYGQEQDRRSAEPR